MVWFVKCFGVTVECGWCGFVCELGLWLWEKKDCVGLVYITGFGNDKELGVGSLH